MEKKKIKRKKETFLTVILRKRSEQAIRKYEIKSESCHTQRTTRKEQNYVLICLFVFFVKKTKCNKQEIIMYIEKGRMI